MPLVIGTIPCIGFSSRNSSITSQFSMDMSWLALTMPEHPEGNNIKLSLIQHSTVCSRWVQCQLKGTARDVGHGSMTQEVLNWNPKWSVRLPQLQPSWSLSVPHLTETTSDGGNILLITEYILIQHRFAAGVVLKAQHSLYSCWITWVKWNSNFSYSISNSVHFQHSFHGPGYTVMQMLLLWVSE